MRWRKLGHVFVASGQYDWMTSHAALPFPVRVDKNRYRIFFTCRNSEQRSHCASLLFDLSTHKVLKVCSQPHIIPGAPGYFDEDGALLLQMVEREQSYYAYYLGWSKRITVPFQNAIGLATCSKQFDNWKKQSLAPIIDRNDGDALSLSYPWVIYDSDLWKMWYGTNQAWEKDGMDMLYVIKYAESDDGINWRRGNHIAIDLQPGESGIARPCVIKENGLYKMWYSIRIGRKEGYLIGYAESADGKIWQRRDEEAGIAMSKNAGDWDGEMVCYPCVFDHDGQRYMLYNGNGFGRTGFGLAVLDAAN